MDSYEQRRKDNLADIIGEYINDENTSALQFYNELMDELNTWQQYFHNHNRKVETMKILINQTLSPTSNKL